MFELNDQDKKLLKEKGISEQKFFEQLKLLEKGVPFINLHAPCTKESGIKTLSDEDISGFIEYYEKNMDSVKPIKFVPASGAASRMFSLLAKTLNSYDELKEEMEAGYGNEDIRAFQDFVDGIHRFAFKDDLQDALKKDGLDLDELLRSKQYKIILEYLLTDKGLDYINHPKALIKFHDYTDGQRAAIEEHLVEALSYAKSTDNTARVHFTILKEHEDKFKGYLEEILSRYETSEVKFDISFSFQSPDTDIVAVDYDNNPLRDAAANLVFRPGGHGALIQNLGNLNSEIIFVKNIDNVVPDRLKEQTYTYKKALGGLLLELKQAADKYLSLIDNGSISEEETSNALEFISSTLDIELPSELETSSDKAKSEFIFNKLNRPFRVCGVVKNEGEPGGGPFWIKGQDGSVSRQIVESAQVDFNNPDQESIWNSSTHFNPVDLVCAIYGYKDNKYDLQKYIDMNTVFITKKSKDGIDLKAMELPGLWNGSMAHWITVFVQVPLITFNPVKTVMDLLKPQHQPG